jgi:GT2 family glycosyltransferase
VHVSVVVPTYNRREDLWQTLTSLAEQSYGSSQYEVIVADDGSTDGTGEMVQSLETPYSLVYAWQTNRGRCAARNLGIGRAKGELILFLDGDMIATPDLVAEHVRSHLARNRVLVRGKTPLWMSQPMTLFEENSLARWCDVEHLVEAEGYLPFGQANTQNLSIKREHLAEIGNFDEVLDVGYAWDDTELAYRAHKAGLRLFYNPAAIAYHNDRVRTLEKQCGRIRLASRNVPLLFQMHPELQGQLRRYVDKVPIAWGRDPAGLVARKVARHALATAPLLGGLKVAAWGLERFYPSPALLRRCYGLIIGSYALKGYREGSRSGEV